MAETPLETLFRPIPKEVFAHQLALGRLCGVWAMIDRTLNELIAIVLDVTAADTACISTEIDNVAGRTRLLKKLLHAKNLPQWWLPMVVASLNRIETELSPLRNRCIHDSWEVTEVSLVRTDRRAFLKKLKAHDSDTLQYDIKHTMSAEDINALLSDCFIAMIALKGACRDIEQHRKSGALVQAKSLLSPVFHTWEDQRKERQQLTGKILPPSPELR